MSGGNEYGIGGYICRAPETPPTAPSGGEVGSEVVGVLVEALAAMIYEATHLSPCKPNGDHDCTIKADTLAEARGALARGRALLPEPVDPVEAIALRLIDQHDEPWPGSTESDRLHYWRDKAIQAANDLLALAAGDRP